ncbi:MAG: hypothetical protein AAGG48_30055 [Planctomycetota bacterium]
MLSPESIAEHFGYTSDWLRLRVVTATDLREQFAVFEQSEDKKTEHYRCAAFKNYLNRIEAVSDETLRDLLSLSDAGPDGCDLSVSRAFELVNSDLLNDEQLQSLRERQDLQQHASFQLLINRALLERRLSSDGLTDSVFQGICALNDPITTQRLLDRDDLTRDHVAWVAEFGCGKRLRNVAMQRLNSRRFRDGG